MSIPFHLITPIPIQSAFVAPWDEPYDPLIQVVLGGTAIGSGELGREVKKWTVFYEDDTIKVAPEDGAIAYTLAVMGVLTCSLSFDANMQVTIAYTKSDGSYLYYFNSLTGVFTTLRIEGSGSCRVCVDDPRLFNSTASDVVFSYVIDDTLFYREQRDRYAIEYTVGPAKGLDLLQAAPSVLNRVQWRLGKYVPPLT